MSRNKLQKFAENEQSNNVIQQGKEIYEQIKGKWRELHFKNDNDIVLELACGRGEYSVGLAEVYPQKNFIGVDIKGSRFWTGSQYALKNNLDNVAFLRTYIQNLENFFAENEVNEIWITFPDPRPKDSDERRRLTNTRFMDIYKKILVPEGKIHFKTDNIGLFEYTLEEVLPQLKIQDLKYTKDLYQSEMLNLHHNIQTRYEKMFSEKGHKINYLKFRFVK